MAATRYGILASIAQRRRRVLIKYDSDSEARVQPRSGEVYLEQTVADYNQRGPDAAVLDHFAAAPLSDRCAVVAAGAVVQLVLADPLIDVHPLGQLVQAPAANIGDTYSNGIFTPATVQQAVIGP